MFSKSTRCFAKNWFGKKKNPVEVGNNLHVPSVQTFELNVLDACVNSPFSISSV